MNGAGGGVQWIVCIENEKKDKRKIGQQLKFRSPGVRRDSFKVEDSEVYFHCDRKEAKRRSKTTENETSFSLK